MSCRVASCRIASCRVVSYDLTHEIMLYDSQATAWLPIGRRCQTSNRLVCALANLNLFCKLSWASLQTKHPRTKTL